MDTLDVASAFKFSLVGRTMKMQVCANAYYIASVAFMSYQFIEGISTVVRRFIREDNPSNIKTDCLKKPA